jgi:small subunit ribosomal protein S16
VAVRIRLQRKGARHMAFYRIVAADSRSPRDGRFIEQLGYYDPLKDPAEINVDTEKVLGWFSKGAKPSETVKSLLSRVGIMETWHHMQQGRTPEEIEQIQEEARKRAEAVAAMERRAKEAEEPSRPEKAAPKAAPAEGAVAPTAIASSEPAQERAGAEEAAPEAVQEEVEEEKDAAD